ncbi:pseudouridine synthase [Pelagophyceae sp. CCMP2097]|nr:pseudouridine synthase [Pelagophyceae sp. CCMP2097]
MDGAPAAAGPEAAARAPAAAAGTTAAAAGTTAAAAGTTADVETVAKHDAADRRGGAGLDPLGASTRPAEDGAASAGRRPAAEAAALAETVVFALHKPIKMTIARTGARRRDVVCGVYGRRGCFETWLCDLETEAGLLPNALFQIGRLDKATSGLLLVTNDGDLAYGLTRRGVCAKRYLARVGAEPAQGALDQLRDGVFISEFGDAPVRATTAVLAVRVKKRSVIDSRGAAVEFETAEADVQLDITCGQKRVVRRILAAVGLPVMRLHRSGIGGLTLGEGDLSNLAESQHRRLDADATAHLWAGLGGKSAVKAWKAEDRLAKEARHASASAAES